jgi:hypothetical protein
LEFDSYNYTVLLEFHPLAGIEMASGHDSDDPPDRTKVGAAEYIALELSRLMRMASANGFTLLPYLIDMAVLEAWREASEPKRAQVPGERGGADAA